MKLRNAALAAAGALGATAFAGSTFAAGDHKNQYSDSTVTRYCGDEADNDTVTFGGPLKMWPPNHKSEPIDITATDGGGDTVTLDTAGTHDEYAEDGTEMNGAGHTSDDVNPLAATGDDGTDGSSATTHEIRAERSGRGDGRTYTIDFVATFDNGAKACHTAGLSEDAPANSMEVPPFKVTVPHDMGDPEDRDGRIVGNTND